MTDQPDRPTPAERDGDSLLAVLDQLNELVSTARAMPMSASALVNRAEVLDLLASARGVVPDQITRADRLVADADAVLAGARAEADRILAEAQARAGVLVSSEAVLREAERRSGELVAQAEATAEKLARDADDYCDRQLAQFEIDLGSIGAQVAAGRARLADRSLPATDEGTP
ncbi:MULTISPECIES: hypothetical protein [unclassified Pseudactinotalea]|uniref:hypothetical protein n=1 Tax=unclassified Pseudactinotalea TaxID=2649176 RepID=UPI00128D7A07|nr:MULTISPECIES: hypothetical protein [unclassified Pseudactinotalea]MPV51209.1 hypothetical protein [Pseudactinotalea sp. HY160]QGH69009.1 hypothetical protein GCE65_05435 [Pseudactinotalea sp. HY158]